MPLDPDFTTIERRTWSREIKKEPAGPPPPPVPVWLLLVRIVLALGPQWCLAATFLITWISPYYFGERMVHHLTFVMLVEFIVVHSTGFTGALTLRDIPRLQRIGMFAGLMCIYLLFIAGFAAMYKGYWPVIAFAYLVISKLPNILFRPVSDDAMFGIMGSWAAMVCLYLGGIFFTFTYDIPPLGVTPEVIAKQAFDVGGEWPEKPYLALAFGTLYFTGLGLLSILTEIFTYIAARRKFTASGAARPA